MANRRVLEFVALLIAAWLFSRPALAEQWQQYADPGHRYEIELPLTSFKIDQSRSGHLILDEVGGAGSLDIYAGANPKHLSPAEFADRLSSAPAIQDITYRAGGSTWFVLSGHYKAGAGDLPLIYYAKYSFSTDLRAVGGFEISYPLSEKPLMDQIVVHLEKTFRLH